MKKRYKLLIIVLGILLAGFVIPEKRCIPVEGATSKDWNANTYWFEPWGKSGVHKGVDIFAKKGTNVVATTSLLILYRGNLPRGGKVILALGPKWRIHYYAHLDAFGEQVKLFARPAQVLGQVGDSGNALGKQAHLHYSIISLIPRPWRMDSSTQGYKKIFYMDPIIYLSE